MFLFDDGFFACKFTFDVLDEWPKDDFEGVVSHKAGGHAVCDGFDFFLVGPKESVPDHQDTAIVFIDIEWVGAVVDAVCGGCIEPSFESGNGADALGVQEELKEQVEQEEHENRLDGKPEQNGGDIENG